MAIWTPRGRKSQALVKAAGPNLPAIRSGAWADIPAGSLRAIDRQGMSTGDAFGPGAPLRPYYGVSATPRTYNVQTGRNISAMPRSDETVSFETMRGLIDTYDIASICIRHRIDDLTSLKYTIGPVDEEEKNVDKWVQQAITAMARPDRPIGTTRGGTPFKSWLKAYLNDVMAYDAGALYRMRTEGGKVCGLKVIDGTTLAPMVNYYGDVPDDDAPAYVQWANGLPWDWLTYGDMVYEQMWPKNGSPYGTAPIETIMLRANSDVRLQLCILQMFTDGTIPGGFMEAPPDLSDPDAIIDLQNRWDATMYGDQAKKHQIRWVPTNAKFTPYREETWNDHLSVFLMQVTCATYSVVPTDIGFTEKSNRATGETQIDVQFRIGTMPLVEFCEGILDSYMQDDLGFPCQGRFDTGQEKEDRVSEAQVWKIGWEMGAASSDEFRSKVLGLKVDPSNPVPRTVMTGRAGLIPLNAIFAVSGQIDPGTYAPEAGAQLPTVPFTGIEGVVAQPPGKLPALEIDEYGTGDDDEGDPRMSGGIGTINTPSGKPAFSGPPTSYDPIEAGRPTAGDDVAKGVDWHNSDGLSLDADSGQLRQHLSEVHQVEAPLPKSRGALDRLHRDEHGRNGEVGAHILKAAKPTGPSAAGLCVKALDTGRVLLLQRSLTEDDPAAGRWELPGGKLDGDEGPLEAALREWEEEIGQPLPAGRLDGSWTSDNGVYRGFVYLVARELDVLINGDPPRIINPDRLTDPDGAEVAAWWDPTQLAPLPMLREEARANPWGMIAHAGQPAVTKARETAQHEHEVSKVAAEDLRRWRNNARSRVAKGRTPRRGDWPAIPADVQDRVWSELARASTRESVDEAFDLAKSADPKVSRPGPGGHREAELVDHWTPKVAEALRSGWDMQAIAQAWAAKNRGKP